MHEWDIVKTVYVIILIRVIFVKNSLNCSSIIWKHQQFLSAFCFLPCAFCCSWKLHYFPSFPCHSFSVSLFHSVPSLHHIQTLWLLFSVLLPSSSSTTPLAPMRFYLNFCAFRTQLEYSRLNQWSFLCVSDANKFVMCEMWITRPKKQHGH